MAAGFVVAHFLGPERLERSDPAQQDDEAQAASRLLAVAEALFVLRNHPGCPALCERLRDRDMASIFFEASMARRFAEAGFEMAVPPVGADWIVLARSGQSYNLKACRTRRPRFQGAALKEFLDEAQANLPADAPAFLCCCYPSSWALDCWDVDFSLGSAARQFLDGARKVNRVGFYREEFVRQGEIGAHSLAGFTEGNSAPHHPAPELEAVVTGPDRTPPAVMPFGGGVPMKFFAWVDWALATAR